MKQNTLLSCDRQDGGTHTTLVLFHGFKLLQLDPSVTPWVQTITY